MLEDFKFLTDLKDGENALIEDDSLFGYGITKGTENIKAEDFPQQPDEISSDDVVHDLKALQLENNLDNLNKDLHNVDYELSSLKQMLINKKKTKE